MPNDAQEIPSQAGKTRLFNLIAAVLVFGFGTIALLFIIPTCMQMSLSIFTQAHEVASFGEGRWVIKSEKKGFFAMRSLYRAGQEKPAIIGIDGFRNQGDAAIFKTSGSYHVLDLRDDSLKVYLTIVEAPAEVRQAMKILGD